MLAELVNGILNRSRNSGAPAPGRGGATGEFVVADAHARYQEAVLQGRVFYACTQAAVATTVGLSATATGIIISNPLGSNVNLILWELLAALATAAAGIATLGLEIVITPANQTHTTPLIVRSALTHQPGGSLGLADSAATLSSVPVACRPIPGGPVAATSITTPFIKDEIAGSLIIPPGLAIATFSLTTTISALLSMTWEEQPAA